MKHKEEHEHHDFMKHFDGMENPNISLNVRISKSNEIERVEILLNGNQKDAQGEHELRAKAELNLNW